MIRERIHRIFRFDSNYFFKGGLKLGIGQVVLMALSFILSLVLVNALSKEAYGQYKYALTIFSLVGVAGLTEMMTAIIRGVARGYSGSIMEGLRVKLLWGSIGTLVGLGVAGYYLYYGQTVLGLAIVVGSVLTPITNALYVYEGYFQGKKQFGRSVTASIVVQCIYSAVVIATVFFSKSIAIIFLTGYGSMLLVRAMYLRRVFRAIPTKSPSDPELMKLGKHLSFIKTTAFVTSSLWNIILFHYFGGVTLALYAVASAPIEQIRGFLLIGENLLLPKVSDPKWRLADARTFWSKLFPVLAIVFGGILFYQLIASWFYGLFFPKYLEVVPYSILLSWSLLLTSVQIVVMIILKARHALRELYIINVVEIIFGTVLALPMIFAYQITGLIISIIIMKVASVTISLFFLFHPTSSARGGTQINEPLQEGIRDLPITFA